MNPSFIFLIYVLSTFPSEAKKIIRQIKTVKIRQEKSWIYIDRMRLGPGQLSIAFSAHLQSAVIPYNTNYRLTLAVVPEGLWMQQLEKKCENYQRDIETIIQNEKQTKKMISMTIGSGQKMINKTSENYEIDEERTYYFIFVDCEKSLINQYFNQKSSLKVEIHILNDDNELGSDQQIIAIVIPSCILVCFFMVRKMKRVNKQYEDLNWPAIIVKIIVWAQKLSLIVYFAGFIIYSFTGVYNQFFNFVYLMTTSFEDAMSLILLTFCALGWMTLYRVNQQEQIYYPLAAVFGFISIVLTLLSKVNDSSPEKYHLYSSVSIYILYILRFIGLLTFLTGILLQSRRYKTEIKKNKHFSKYQLGLLLIGLLSFISLPLIILLCKLISVHKRYVTVFLFTELYRLSQNYLLYYQVSKDSSTYGRITMYGKSFMEDDDKLK